MISIQTHLNKIQKCILYITSPDNGNDKKWTRASWYIVSCGMLVRIWQYACNRSLWIDEAMLARNILSRDYFGLLQPLDYNQGAPVLFLWLTKFTTVFLGTGEFGLRLIPLLASLVSIILFYLIAKSYLDARHTAFSVFIFAFSQRLVYYAQEFKQYSTDVTTILLLVYIFLKITEKNEITKYKFYTIAILGTVSTYFSHSSIFTIAAIGSLLFLMMFDGKNVFSRRQILILLFSWCTAFLINYVIFLNDLQQNDFLESYWASAFLPVPVSADAATIWTNIISNFLGFAGYSSIFQIVAILLCGTALISGVLKKSPIALLIGMMIFFTFLASMIGAYPFKKRLVLFLIPFLILLIAKGSEIFVKEKKFWPVFLTFFFITAPTFIIIHKSIIPIKKEEIRDTLNYLKENIESNDSVYVYYGASHAVKYYIRDEKDKLEKWTFGIKHQDNPDKYIYDINTSKINNRVWLIFSHTHKDEEKYILSHFDGKIVDKYNTRGSRLYLLNLENNQNTTHQQGGTYD